MKYIYFLDKICPYEILDAFSSMGDILSIKLFENYYHNKPETVI